MGEASVDDHDISRPVLVREITDHHGPGDVRDEGLFVRPGTSLGDDAEVIDAIRLQFQQRWREFLDLKINIL